MRTKHYHQTIRVLSAPLLLLGAMTLGRAALAQTPGTITTIAGTGSGGYSGDGVLATTTTLNGPAGIALASDGTIYLTDALNSRIRKIITGGTILTVAGTGTPNLTGDGGPAASAQVNNPTGIAVDAQGNVIFADTSNNRIREIDTQGNITSIAGSDITPGFGGDNGPATSAQLNTPGGVAVDAQGNVYFSDTKNHRVRRIDSAGVITTVAGTGTKGFSGDGGSASIAQLSGPAGLAADAAGSLYIADSGNRRVRKVTGNVISTVAGSGTTNPFSPLGDGGPALSAAFFLLSGVTVDSQGDLFIADGGLGRVREVDASGTISTVAGGGSGGDNGPATQASLAGPVGLAIDKDGNLLIAETAGHRIRKVFLSSTTPPTPISGDLNGDGSVTVQDVIVILTLAVSSGGLTPSQKAAADLNNDGSVNVLDAIIALRRSVGLT